MIASASQQDAIPISENLSTLGASRAMSARGADVTAVDVGPVGHDASMLTAAPLILAWLRELETKAK